MAEDLLLDGYAAVNLHLRRARVATVEFTFLQSDSAYSISGIAFQLLVKASSGKSTNLFTRTLGSGLTLSSSNVLTAAFTEVLTDLVPKAYYWELYDVTSKITWLSGDFIIYQADSDIPDSDTSLTVNIGSAGISVEVNAGRDNTKQNLVNSAAALVDAATIDLTAIKHTLSSSSVTRTFTISYTGDDISMKVILSNTAAVYTFPADALCVNSSGSASGNNTCSLSGVSGDVYVFAIKHWGGGVYTVVCKNTGQ